MHSDIWSRFKFSTSLLYVTHLQKVKQLTTINVYFYIFPRYKTLVLKNRDPSFNHRWALFKPMHNMASGLPILESDGDMDINLDGNDDANDTDFSVFLPDGKFFLLILVLFAQVNA